MFLAAGLLSAAEFGPPPARLTVHEWGTFTSIANQDGVPQVWQGSASLPLVVVFENRGGRIGYRLLHGLAASNIVGIEQLPGGGLTELRQDLEAGLIQNGLYPREATAMLDTWRDSWFEEGVRAFYMLPQSAVDEVLPLSISPLPVQIVRTFVGRVEVLAPWMRDEIVPALRGGDVDVLAKYGRFLQSFMQQIGTTPHAARTDTWLNARRSQAVATPCQ